MKGKLVAKAYREDLAQLLKKKETVIFTLLVHRFSKFFVCFEAYTNIDNNFFCILSL